MRWLHERHTSNVWHRISLRASIIRTGTDLLLSGIDFIQPSVAYITGNNELNGHRVSWWRHQMKTFSALMAICAGNSPVPGEFPHKGHWRGALMFFFFFHLRLNKRLSEQSWDWWSETPPRSLWRRGNVSNNFSDQCLYSNKDMHCNYSSTPYIQWWC